MKKYILGLGLLSVTLATTTTSCSDFFETESTHVIYADKDHLNVASDTIYSMIGILNRLQALGDRTFLLGEVRGDLMDVTDYTSADLRDVAMFNVGDDNKYNVPRDYYAVINNCNYYIAKADTALKNNRNQYLFRAEFAAAKAIRAWTYLQLVTTYGKVPFVTEPILTKEDAEKTYPEYGIKEVCEYFLNEDGLENLAYEDYPEYGLIKGISSQYFYIPVNLVLGDLYLWYGQYAASPQIAYLNAANCYYNYLTTSGNRPRTRIKPTGTARVQWSNSSWDSWRYSYTSAFSSESSEIIFVIPGDSIPSEGYYSELRNLMNTSEDNNYQASLTLSQAIIDLSAAQTYCYADESASGSTVTYSYAPKNLPEFLDGDLRLQVTWSTANNQIDKNGNRYTYQYNAKLATRNIRMYRLQLVYLRLAEAMNCAGYPHYAYQVLASGINSDILKKEVQPHYHNRLDSLVFTAFDFPSTVYGLYDPSSASTEQNTQGIHSRGSGFSMHNEFYTMPVDSTITDSLQLKAWQRRQVEDMIIDEEALEFAFEGYRYYDLLRVALRRYNDASDPNPYYDMYFKDDNFLAKKILNRRGGADTGITTNLADKHNWFLHWNNQIGY